MCCPSCVPRFLSPFFSSKPRLFDASFLPQFEIALRNVARNVLFPTASTDKEREERQKAVPEIQLQLKSGSRLMQFRELGVRSSSLSFP